MKLSPDDFNRHLRFMGQEAQWRKGFACPCVNPTSGAAKAGCPQCGGKGWFWDAPVDCVIGVAGRDVQRAWENFGVYQSGDQVVIIGSDQEAYEVGPYDRMLSLNRTEPFSINFTRGVNERIRFHVEQIDRVIYFDATQKLVDAPIPDVDSDGNVVWGDGGPPPATTYSVTGRRMAEFFVFRDMPFDRPHHAGLRLPRRVVLRRFDLFSR